jgi:hypothetical protein
MATLPTSTFLNESEDAENIGISKRDPTNALKSKSSAYFKLNKKLIRYHLPNLKKWMNQHTTSHERKDFHEKT